MSVKSHTRTLLERVKAEELYGSEEGVIRQTVALAEYVKDYRDDIDEDEFTAAEALIRTFFDADMSNDMITEILTDRADSKGVCIRCGRILSMSQSVDRGMGPVCYAKAEEDDWNFSGDDTTVDIRKSFMRCNDAKPLTDKNRLGLKRIAVNFGVSLSVVRRDRRELKKQLEVENQVQRLILGDTESDTDTSEVNQHFDESISCIIYKRKGDGTHCKKQCKRSRQ